MIVRELVATLGLDFLSEGFEKAEKAFESLEHKASAVAGVVGAGIAAFTALTIETAEHAEKVKLLSTQLGIEVEDFQRLTYAASLTKVGMEEMAGGLMHLRDTLKEAGLGGEEQAATFGRLGIRIRDASGKVKQAKDVMLELADRIRGMTDPVKRSQAAIALLGETGARMLPTLAKGADEFRVLAHEADKMGVTMSEETVEAMTKFAESLTKVKQNFLGFSYQLAARFLPSLAKVVDGISDWYDRHRELIAAISGYAVQYFAHALEAVGVVVRGLVDGLDWLFKTLNDIHPALAVAAALAAVVGLAFASPLIATLALSAAILGIVDDIAVFIKGGDSMLGRLIDWAGGLLGTENAAKEAREALEYLFSGELGEDLFDFLDNAKKKLFAFFDGIVAKVDAVRSFFKSMVPQGDAASKPGTFGGLAAEANTAEFASAQMGKMIGGGAVGPRAAAELRGGGDLSLDGPGGGKKISAKQTNHITVNAPQGMSPEELGNAIAEKIDDHWSQQMQATHAALTDGVASPAGQ